jgi:RNA 2',3'-cyclic 3'-phosphodiesterase
VNFPPDKIRAFVALRMSAETEDAVAGFVETLRESSAGIGWTRRERLHLTLRFLGGEVPAEKLERLSPALAEIAATSSAFKIDVRGTGVFPNFNRPRVIWVGLESEALMELAARVGTAAVGAGFASDQRAYKPHLTIARIRDPRAWRPVRARIADAANLDFGGTPIDSMMLYQSKLGAEPAYIQLAQYMFHG